MQVRRESVSQLTCVRRQVHAYLLELHRQHARRRLVAAELAVQEPLPLLRAAYDGPHQKVRHVNGHRLREAGELGRVIPDSTWIALCVER